MVMPLLRKLFKPRFDPERVATVIEKYDEKQGYRKYHEYCRDVFARKTEEQEDSLTQFGLEHIPVFHQDTTPAILQTILSKTEGSFRKKTIDYSEILLVPDRQFLDGVFQRIFHPSLDQKLIRYFQSEYCMYWFALLRAQPTPQSRRSFLWHCDKGPSCHLKLLLFLNNSEEHGGNTEFVDRHTTAQFAKSGYLFGPVEARIPDISHLAKKLKISYEPQMWPMKAGEAILFEPSKVLHRGILPTKGPRYILALCLVPSPIHWHDAFVRTQCSGLNKDYTWQTHASDIQRTLAL